MTEASPILATAAEPAARPGSDEVEVLVVGAGLSGVCAAYHLSRARRDFAVLEARDALGGTWDLFRYPGVRSDSDVQTLGYSFHPWRGERSITDGPSILAYIREAAQTHGFEERVRLRHRAVAASWDTASARWTVEVEVGGPEGATARRRIRCRFLFLCTGYYDYAAGHAPSWPGMEVFEGRVVHPQTWPEDLDHAGRRVAVIGSGATAVTLVPELARTAGRVVMVQRSPTYVAAMPAADRTALWLARRLPAGTAHGLTRWKNILLGMWVYQLARRAPGLVKAGLAKAQREALGPEFDVATHFTPSYDPWDQRLCLAPDGDFFEALRSGAAEIVTDAIERFTPRGLRLASGREVEADLVVTATGLKLRFAGGMALSIDGRPVRFPELHSYKGAMFTGVPNLALAMGYTNASWTLKCDLIARHVVRLLARMDARGWDFGVPEPPPPGTPERPVVGLTSGYIRRDLHTLPRQTDRAPWRLPQNYLTDLRLLRFGRLGDHMRFGRAAAPEPQEAAAAREVETA